ncbi:YqeG family HAD IIIA-type phosphatase [Candidatus Saccharibacteria bacterium]|nr:YqeG family HAD IIIA-type phosphatase [Candidatus Saccharibacteria bacterium]
MRLFCVDKNFERFEDVTPKILKDAGVKLLLCDLDNTLRLHSEKEPADELVEWIKDIKEAGIEVVIISNNGRKKFMKKFCEPLGISCVWWAKKPLSTKLTATMEEYNFKPQETVMLGDKLTTDALAAHFAKIRAWKVNHRRNVV